MADMTMREDVRENMVAALKGWREEGYNRPAIPMYADANGDGIPDYYALDAFGRLIVVDSADVSGYDLVENLGQGEDGP